MNNRKTTRLTLSDLNRMVENTVKRVVNESVDQKREIQLAYKELQQMGKHLAPLGLRLDNTRYSQLFNRLKDAMTTLNNALIGEIKGQRQL